LLLHPLAKVPDTIPKEPYLPRVVAPVKVFVVFASLTAVRATVVKDVLDPRGIFLRGAHPD
jgi:hypothetical protein